jgi:NADH:ubiquinone oxidoreductase subunit C
LIHVYSPQYGIQVFVHVPVELSGATVPSISGIYGGAIWHERECHEMFGIDFEGHPRLVGLYLPEDFEGHPGLRSFKLPTRTLVKPWPGAKDPDEAAAGGR